jgi:2-polyprenyl-3-methyl-5-hydroxy-6-metoxy-1,4-benzoquinol methylase
VQLPQFVMSPLTGRDSPLISTIPSQRLVDGYKQRYGYDATHCFKDVPLVGLYRCDTGFCFYYPFSVAGDESLYRCLEKFDWNYKEDKWEYRAALSYVRTGDRVLDVGCGEGNFLTQARARGAETWGIDPNRTAAQIARSKDLAVFETLPELHEPVRSYDLITAFQVLEHVVDPIAFIEGCVGVLRPGGVLIVGVPNNDSFLRFASDNYLNNPPHHMGLWNRDSLAALAQITGLDIVTFEIEPLAETDWYQAVMENRYLGRWQRRLYFRLGFAKTFARYVRENAATIAGHTIIAVYRKKAAS